jgi:hypothetical protein
MVKKGTVLPFDNMGYRAIMFDIDSVQGHEAAEAELRSAVMEVQKSSYKVSNPVTHARGFARMAASEDSKDVMIANLAAEVANLRSMITSTQSMITSATASVAPSYQGLLAPELAQRVKGIMAVKRAAELIADQDDQIKQIARALVAEPKGNGEGE